MLNTVLIRVDGSTQIGLGHLIRSYALAHMLKKDYDVRFFCKEIPDGILSEFNKNNFLTKIITNEEDFFQIITGQEIVVLDNYFFDPEYQKRIKRLGCKLVCIDDIHHQEYYADLIINHAPGIIKEDYKAQKYTRFALGLDYVLLRPEFIDAALNYSEHRESNSVLICFGGGDFRNLSEVVVKTVLTFHEFKNIIVITGAAYKHKESILKLASSNSRIEYYDSIDGNKMMELMKRVTLCILPASSILFEAIAVGCNVISGLYVDNQKYIVNANSQINFFINAGDFSNTMITHAINEYINNSKKEEHSRRKRAIDGHSGFRILNEFKKL